jgi:hypothetical protein
MLAYPTASGYPSGLVGSVSQQLYLASSYCWKSMLNAPLPLPCFMLYVISLCLLLCVLLPGIRTRSITMMYISAACCWAAESDKPDYSRRSFARLGSMGVPFVSFVFFYCVLLPRLSRQGDEACQQTNQIGRLVVKIGLFALRLQVHVTQSH